MLACVAALYPERREELARIVSIEVGKPITQALGDLVHVDVKKLGRIPDGGGKSPIDRVHNVSWNIS